MIIGKKIGLTCAALSALSVAIGGASLILDGPNASLSRKQHVDGCHCRAYTKSSAPKVCRKTCAAAMMKHILSKSDQDRSRFDSEISGARDQFTVTMQAYEKTITRAVDRDIFVKIEPAFKEYVAAWEAVRAVSAGGQQEAAFAQFQSSVLSKFEALNKVIADEVEVNKSFGQELSEASVRADSQAQLVDLELAPPLAGRRRSVRLLRGAGRQRSPAAGRHGVDRGRRTDRQRGFASRVLQPVACARRFRAGRVA